MAVVQCEQNGSTMGTNTNVRDIPDDLYEAIKALAKKDLRSINAEIVVLLQEAVARRQAAATDQSG